MIFSDDEPIDEREVDEDGDVIFYDVGTQTISGEPVAERYMRSHVMVLLGKIKRDFKYVVRLLFDTDTLYESTPKDHAKSMDLLAVPSYISF